MERKGKEGHCLQFTISKPLAPILPTPLKWILVAGIVLCDGG